MIMDAIQKEMMPFMIKMEHKQYLQKFCASMKEMIGLWFKLQRVMKAVDLQTDEAIAQFARNTDHLRQCIYKFVVSDPPIPGMGLKLPKQLKTHILFDGHVLDLLHGAHAAGR